MTDPIPAAVSRWQSDELVAVLRGLGEREAFDVIWAERHMMAEMVHRAGYRKNVIVDLDDLGCSAMARELRLSPWYASKPLHYLELAKLAWYERSLTRRYARLVLCKEEDRRFFGSSAERVAVIPNGVDAFAPQEPEREQDGRILFTGVLDFAPNVDAVHFFASRVLPLVRKRCPNAQFHVVGRSPHPRVRALHDGTSLIVHPDVADMAPFFAEAALVVAPIRMGSGTRLKVIEALGRGKALVSTTTGAEGLDLRPCADLEVEDDPTRFADACVRLLADPEARRRLGASGRARVEARYLWESIELQVEQMLVSVAGGSDRPLPRQHGHALEPGLDP
jgi:glycosyltransferase involved in cell wall biosynthesis